MKLISFLLVQLFQISQRSVNFNWPEREGRTWAHPHLIKNDEKEVKEALFSITHDIVPQFHNYNSVNDACIYI